MFSKRLTLLTATAASAAAFALPAAAQASPCVVHLPGPGGTWDTAADGSLGGPLDNNGFTFDKGHGTLKVNGVAYPSVGQSCASVATAVSYPAKSVGGLTVARSISVVGSRIRFLDTIYNPSAQGTSVDVDYRLSVTGSQISENSETGSGFEVTAADHWATLRNDGTSKPFLQWGQKGDGAHDPAILSDDPDSPNVWKHKAATMPDATLKYDGIVLGPKATIRLLHVGGSAADAPAAIAAAKDRAAPFSGYTKATAATIVNWGNDSDGDGVSKFLDECPAAKGGQPNGCPLQIKPPAQDPDPQPPVDPSDPGVPQPPTNPSDPGNGNGGTGGGTGGGGGNGSALDTTAPTIAIAKLGKTVKKAKVGRLAPRISCNEACRVTVKVQVTRKGRKKATTILTTKATPLSTKARTIALKVKPSKLTSLRRQRVTVRITARDAAGNSRTVSRNVTLKR